MKKLLQINVTANSGSTGHIAEQLGLVAISHGWDSFIAYGRSSNNSQSYLIRIGSKFDILYHVFLTRFFDIHGFGSKRATKKLINKIQKIKPDIIHLHNIHGYYINYPILFDFLSKSNIPVVWTMHDCWAFTGHCAHFSLINCYKWQTRCSNCPQIQFYPMSFVDNSIRNFDLKKRWFLSLNNIVVISVSKWLDNLISKSFFNILPHRFIYNGVNTSIFYPYPVLHKDKFSLIAVASSWSKSKGLFDYIQLASKLDSSKYELTLVGIDPKIKKILPSTIKSLPKTNSQQELAMLYSNVDVVLNLSYQETFGLTIVEGFACGTPGIVYNSTASPELLDEKTGFIVEPGDIEGVINAIKKIESRGKNYYSAACRQRAVDCFDKSKNYEKYFELYEMLLKNNGKNIK